MRTVAHAHLSAHMKRFSLCGYHKPLTLWQRIARWLRVV